MKILSLAALLALSCAPVRTVTYPPSFNYIPQPELRTAMWQLAADVVELQRLLDQAPPLIVADDVLARLSQLEAHIATLDGKPSNHPKLDENLASFRRDVEAAKGAAAANPPSYFLAKNLTHSCTSCHQSR